MADQQPPPPYPGQQYPGYGGAGQYGASSYYAGYPQGTGYDASSYYGYYQGAYQQAQPPPPPGGPPAPAPPLPPGDGSSTQPPPPPPDGGAAGAEAGTAGGKSSPPPPPPPPPALDASGAAGQPPLPSGNPPPPTQQPPAPSYYGQQQPGQAAYPGAYPSGTGQPYDYSQYYAQYQQYYSGYQQQQQYGGYGQQPGYPQQQQQYGRYGQGPPPPTAGPPPSLPPPGGPAAGASPQPAPPAGAAEPAWKQAAQRVAAEVVQRAQQQASYHAVPPPGSTAGAAAAARAPGPGRLASGGAGLVGFAIKSQAPKPRAQGGNPLVDAFNAAAAALGQQQQHPPNGAAAGGLSKPGAPAYIRVGAPAGQAQQAQQAGGVQQPWPPSLKAWVERLFRLTDAKQRPKLQTVLKAVIQEATSKGELWTRDWDTMPLPDLSQSPEEAAAILSEVAAVSGPAPAAAGQQRSWAQVAGGGRASRWQQGPPAGAAAAHAAAANGGGPAWGAAAWHAGGSARFSPLPAGSKRGRDDEEEDEGGWRGGRGGRYDPRADRRRGDREDRHAAARRKKRVQYCSDSSGYESGGSEEGLSFEERRRRARRAGRFGGGGGGAYGAGGRPVGGGSAEERRQRLLAMLEEGDAEDIDWDSLAIKGTSQAIEKSYFRLTSAPDPSTVRPEPVLARALERLVGLIRAKQVNYLYALDQFKGMRQDCTVQHIRNELAARVYEAHARAALEYGDVAEYNQCQSQVAVLYQEGVPGCRVEFLAYRILYQAVHAKHGEILQLLNTLKRVTQEDARKPEVAYALRVRRALGAEDWALVFQLYRSAPKLGRALLDLAVPKLRYAALCALVKAYRPGLSVRFVARVLGFTATAAAAAAGGGVPTPASTPGPSQQLQLPSVSPSPAGPLPAAAAPAPAAAAAEAAAAALARPPQLEGMVVEVGAEDSTSEPLPGSADAVFVGKYAPKADEAEGVRDCLEWLADCGAVVTGAALEEYSIDCKASTGQLRVPEDKTAVAHGDANLAIDDFLSKAFSEAAT